MRVDWAIPCRYVEVQQGTGATIVGAGADIAFVPELPTAVQLLFAVRYVGAPEEVESDTSHPIACRIFSPAGDLLGEQTSNLTAHATQLVPGFVAELVVPTAVVLNAQEFGSYGFEFRIDKSDLRVPVHIVRPPPLDN